MSDQVKETEKEQEFEQAYAPYREQIKEQFKLVQPKRTDRQKQTFNSSKR
ncbi:TPA: hypothetical protein N2299_001829 [Enterobacter hormaechei]|nr:MULTISPECIES: hypothetical protein [Enterobacter cloacae complex]HED3541874.1 hypothetical protein [Enterobacter hormaechei subsp. hormaechei]ELD3451353.1 hypothetical protein [Enterobacter hormaechei]MCO0811941.1 hypothetical protein [Enterobacter hormaechei]MCY0807102.1 hypothetical protein [Enterobacter cloacae complex sp. 2022EL-00747]HCD7307366.1 hypothetical protein [Enterobacter hormaechei]